MYIDVSSTSEGPKFKAAVTALPHLCGPITRHAGSSLPAKTRRMTGQLFEAWSNNGSFTHTNRLMLAKEIFCVYSYNESQRDAQFLKFIW